MTYEFLQHYWCFIVSLLGALLVFLLFVQGANSMIFQLGKTPDERRLLIDREVIIIESLHYPSPQICQEVLPRTAVNISKSPHLAYLDADKIHGSLTLRTPRTGDTFAPFGMHGKRKLLSDFLTNLKLSLFEKEHQSLLMDGTEIVWVVGKRSSELYRVDENTQRVVVLSMK
jgi:tRNA(Ile)-lysidine synthetase-like protein